MDFYAPHSKSLSAVNPKPQQVARFRQDLKLIISSARSSLGGAVVGAVGEEKIQAYRLIGVGFWVYLWFGL